ncbi:ParB/RepB/Spo0J family partition protein [Chitinivorax sp. PXF-14]|uniref:ParB/RepB/Spo0J family partition protein n=1 Tax=Chitinivorax sp. PXF-14 TaxID=3230488 RepID=UPI003466B7B1
MKKSSGLIQQSTAAPLAVGVPLGLGVKPPIPAAPRLDEIEKVTSEDKILDLEIDKLDDNPYGPRTKYDQQEIADMLVSVTTYGQLSPIIVTEGAKPGRFIVVAGGKRRRALALRNEQGHAATIKGVLRPGLTPRDLYLLANEENERRSDHTDYDRALVWKRLLDDRVYQSIEDICNEVGCTRSTASKILAFNDLPLVVLRVIDDNPKSFTYNVVQEIRSLINATDEETGARFAEEISERKLSVRDTAEAKRKYLSRRPGAAKRGRLKVWFQATADGGVSVVAKERKDGNLFVVEAAGLTTDQKRELTATIEEYYKANAEKVST